ncbi:hypothetical protein [Streptomyces sp. P9-A2]|uniref:hypothetical protein n=1 Tax=Streptomyces sp. P9-A2 TaxID=3072284 RepID=UPI002FC89877
MTPTPMPPPMLTRLLRRGRRTEPDGTPAPDVLGAPDVSGTSGTSGTSDVSGTPGTRNVPGAPDAPGAPDVADVQPATEAGESEAAPEPAGTTRDARSGRIPAGRLRRAALAGSAALLLVAGCGFFYGAHQLRSAPPVRNQALTDTEATTRVAGEVGHALARAFSYTPDGTAAAERSARTALSGRAARQYQALFDQVREDLTEQHVTLSTRVARTGVIELDGGKARLLVFLDQTSHRGKDTATTAAAQLTVTARLVDDQWRITDIKAR